MSDPQDQDIDETTDAEEEGEKRKRSLAFFHKMRLFLLQTKRVVSVVEKIVLPILGALARKAREKGSKAKKIAGTAGPLLAPVLVVILILIVASLLFAFHPAGDHPVEGPPKTQQSWQFSGGTTQTEATLGSTPGPDANDPTWIKGKFGYNALEFDGNDYVNCSYSLGLDFDQPLSLETWVKVEELPSKSGSMPILSRSDGSRINYWLGIVGGDYCENGEGAFCFWREDKNGKAYKVCSDTVPKIGKWYQIGATDNGENLKIFLVMVDEGDFDFFLRKCYATAQAR